MLSRRRTRFDSPNNDGAAGWTPLPRDGTAADKGRIAYAAYVGGACVEHCLYDHR